jgi:hypothetical protein
MWYYLWDGLLAPGASQEEVEAVLRDKGWGTVEVQSAIVGWLLAPDDDMLGERPETDEPALRVAQPDGSAVVLVGKAEGKRAVRNLQLAVKQIRLRRQRVAASIRQVKQSFAASKPAAMGPRIAHGRGALGGIGRAVDHMARTAHTGAVAAHASERQDALDPLEAQKAYLDTLLLDYERIAHGVNDWLLRRLG